MKNEMLTGYFITNQESAYYQSETFTKVLRFVQQNPGLCRMKETKNRLTMTFMNIKSVETGLSVLKRILSE
jgi:transcription-repair coupling factor (superfamily II helicase)